MRLFITIIIVTLTACGWHLRGNIELPDNAKTVILLPNDPYSQQQRAFRQLLTLSGVTIVNHVDPMQPALTLYLEPENITRVPATIGIDGEVKAYAITYNSGFYVTDSKGRLLVPKQSISQSETTFHDPNNQLLSSQNNERQVINKLRAEANAQLLRQFARSLRPRDDDYLREIPFTAQ